MDSQIESYLAQLERSIVDGDVERQRSLYRYLQREGYEDEAANITRIVYDRMPEIS